MSLLRRNTKQLTNRLNSFRPQKDVASTGLANARRLAGRYAF
jgi:hypothetical protein